MLSPSLKKYVWALIIVAILGFLDASYLTVAHYLKTPIPCGLVEGCDVVTTSTYSEIAGVPVALLGALYYLAILILSIVSIEKADRRLLRYTSYLTWSGFLASLYFVGIQLFSQQSACGAWFSHHFDRRFVLDFCDVLNADSQPHSQLLLARPANAPLASL